MNSNALNVKSNDTFMKLSGKSYIIQIDEDDLTINIIELLKCNFTHSIHSKFPYVPGAEGGGGGGGLQH